MKIITFIIAVMAAITFRSMAVADDTIPVYICKYSAEMEYFCARIPSEESSIRKPKDSIEEVLDNEEDDAMEYLD